MTILVFPGCTGTPNGHLEVQISILLILGRIWEPSWDPLWRHFRDFPVIWVTKWFSPFPLVHEFGDLRSGFRCHFDWFWCSGSLFLILEGPRDRVEI